MIENALMLAGPRAQSSFYRTSNGAEIDLVVEWPSGELWAIEVKRSVAPKPERGLYSAIADLQPARAFIVYPGKERYRLGESIEAIGLVELCDELQRAAA